MPHLKTEKYIYAYDPVIQRRVVHVVDNKGYAHSLVTGNKFKLLKKGKKDE